MSVKEAPHWFRSHTPTDKISPSGLLSKQAPAECLQMWRFNLKFLQIIAHLSSCEKLFKCKHVLQKKTCHIPRTHHGNSWNVAHRFLYVHTVGALCEIKAAVSRCFQTTINLNFHSGVQSGTKNSFKVKSVKGSLQAAVKGDSLRHFSCFYSVTGSRTNEMLFNSNCKEHGNVAGSSRRHIHVEKKGGFTD